MSTQSVEKQADFTAKNILSNPNTAYMHEVDGLRGIALTLVVLFHVFGDGMVSGGVDVFLVLSAYFLTRKLVSTSKALKFSISNSKKLRAWLAQHYLRVTGRLLPSAIIVLAFILVGTATWSSAGSKLQTIDEVIAASLYFENWQLINSQLGYEAAGPSSSPVQHFWSLSVQGQFFFFWPLIAFVIFIIFKSSHRNRKNIFLWLTAIATLGSFAYAIYLVKVDQEVAYFNTFARFWELGAGALMVFIPGSFLAFRWLREISIYAGLVVTLFGGFFLDGASTFPGAMTLWPVGATLLILFGASRTCDPGYSQKLLSTSVVKYLALIGYELYLWHWPLLIFYLQFKDQARVGWKGASVVVISSFILATITNKAVTQNIFTEQPIINVKKAMAARFFPLLTLIIVSLIWTNSISLAKKQNIVSVDQNQNIYVGAGALYDSSVDKLTDPETPFLPSLETAYSDRASIYKEGCVQTVREEPGAGEVLICDVDNYGNDKTVVLTGGSYIAQWYPAIQEVAKRNNWHLYVVEKNGCRLTANSSHTHCAEWNEQAPETIISLNPDLVVTLGTVVSAKLEIAEQIDENMIFQAKKITDKGIPVVGIRGTPKFPFKVPECLEDASLDYNACNVKREKVFSDEAIAQSSKSLPKKYYLIDLTDNICEPDICKPIVGNILAYRDQGHLTANFNKTLMLPLEDALLDLERKNKF